MASHYNLTLGSLCGYRHSLDHSFLTHKWGRWAWWHLRTKLWSYDSDIKCHWYLVIFVSLKCWKMPVSASWHFSWIGTYRILVFVFFTVNLCTTPGWESECFFPGFSEPRNEKRPRIWYLLKPLRTVDLWQVSW